MEIRSEAPDDHGLIGLLYRQAFVGNYEAELVDALRASGAAPIRLVATEADELLGHILFADVELVLDSRPVAALALAEMAVHEGRRGEGIGGRLVEAGLDAARRRSAEAVLVLGHPTYYPRHGFSAALARHLRVPFRGGDAFMALELVPGVLGGRDGRVVFPPAFQLGQAR